MRVCMSVFVICRGVVVKSVRVSDMSVFVCVGGLLSVRVSDIILSVGQGENSDKRPSHVICVSPLTVYPGRKSAHSLPKA